MTHSKDDLIRKAKEVIIGHQFAIDTWTPYLAKKDDAFPGNLADCAFVIFLGCLRDLARSIDKDQNNKRLHEAIESSNDKIFARSLKEIFGLSILSADFISRMSRDEQIFLISARDRMVHGYLNGSTEPQKSFMILTPPDGTGSPFRDVQVKRREIETIIKEIAPGGIMQGAKTLRSKYHCKVNLLIKYLKLSTNFSADNVETALSKGLLLVNSDLKENYEALRHSLDKRK